MGGRLGGKLAAVEEVLVGLARRLQQDVSAYGVSADAVSADNKHNNNSPYTINTPAQWVAYYQAAMATDSINPCLFGRLVTSGLLPRTGMLSSPRHDVTFVAGAANLRLYLALRAANPTNSSEHINNIINGIAYAVGYQPSFVYDPSAPNNQRLTPPLYYPGNYRCVQEFVSLEKSEQRWRIVNPQFWSDDEDVCEAVVKAVAQFLYGA